MSFLTPMRYALFVSDTEIPYVSQDDFYCKEHTNFCFQSEQLRCNKFDEI